MEGFSIVTQLSSMAAVVGAAVGLTWVVKRFLGSVPWLNCIPVWVYTSGLAGGLAYFANRITGTLPGVTGYVVIDAIVMGAIASGVRDWAKEGVTKPLGASETAIQARSGTGDGSVRPPRGNTAAMFLPLLLASGLVGGSLAVTSCAGTIKSPVITGEDQASVRAAAAKVLGGIEVAGIVVRDSRQMVSDLTQAGLVPVTVRTAVNDAVIRANYILNGTKTTPGLITELATATRLVTVEDLKRRGVDALQQLASLLEAQTDFRVQTAGKFLRSAMAAIEAMGGAR